HLPATWGAGNAERFVPVQEVPLAHDQALLQPHDNREAIVEPDPAAAGAHMEVGVNDGHCASTPRCRTTSQSLYALHRARDRSARPALRATPAARPRGPGCRPRTRGRGG